MNVKKENTFIARKNMASVYSITDISSHAAYQHFMNCEDEVLYILDEGGGELQGVLSIGDLERFYNGDRDQLEINTRYTCLRTVDYKSAEVFFAQMKTVNEIPIVTEDRELVGVIRQEKEEKLRTRQRKTLKRAMLKRARMRENDWGKKEILRFVNTTKAKVLLYTYSPRTIAESLNPKDKDRFIKRQENKHNYWKGLSDLEWRRFWGKEYEDGLIETMKEEFMVKSNPTITNGITRFSDYKGLFYTFGDGERITPNNPSNADKRIIMIGPCVILGSFCKNDQTIAAYLQDYLIKDQYMSWKVLNKGIAGCGHCYAKLFTERFSEDDIVVIWYPENWIPDGVIDKLILQKDLTETFLNTPNLIDNIANAILHCNYVVNQKLAEEIYKDIRKTGLLDNVQKHVQVSESMQKYYIPWEIYEYFIEYFEKYRLQKEEDDIKVGAIVMNCNPFTKGHRYLIEQACSKVDKLYIFVVEEDRSYFKFADRLAMVKLGVSDLSNVYVLPSGNYILSKDTFAQYFEKETVQIIENMDYDIYIFGDIVASRLGIRYRFVGEEPFDRVTKRYNETMQRILPDFGVEVIEIKRKVHSKYGVISATVVREALQKQNWDIVEELCGKAIAEYIKEHMSICCEEDNENEMLEGYAYS